MKHPTLDFAQQVELRWASEVEARSSTLPCKLCGAQARLLVSAPDVVNGVFHRVHRCVRCQSCSYADERQGGIYDTEVLGRNWEKYYLQIGAGVEFMIDVIERLAFPAASTLLDVGCGSGFAADYFASLPGKSASGVEPSAAYRELDLRGLDVSIDTRPLEQVIESLEKGCDLVTSFEVVEHVPSVMPFLANLRRCLAPGGVLVLSTPNARFIDPGARRLSVYAALAPGEHRLLFSAPALRRSLREAGFAELLVVEQGEQLIAYASSRPMKIARSSTPDHYLDYLKLRVQTLRQGEASPELLDGFEHQLFREHVKRGDLGAAEQLLSLLSAHLIDSEAELDRLAAVGDFDEYGDRYPFFLGSLHFYVALLEQARGDLTRAAERFAVGIRILEKEVALSPAFFMSSAMLLGLARLHFGTTSIRAGDAQSGAEILEILAADTSPLLDPLTRARAQLALARHELKRGRLRGLARLVSLRQQLGAVQRRRVFQALLRRAEVVRHRFGS